MNYHTAFRIAIRVVFLFAFIAFLSASISHIATFFHNFEADKSNWIGPYMLAISIDLTALVLTIGVMFFRRDMPWYAVLITWIFIFLLTAFSWIVNFEYAQTYQGDALKTNSFLTMLNPVLASSFSFFNLVYSFVGEFFAARVKTADELLAEADRLEALEAAQKRIDAIRERNRKASLIQRVKTTAIEAKEALNEVVHNQTKNSDEIAPLAAPVESINEVSVDAECDFAEVETEPQTEEDNREHNEEDTGLIRVLSSYPKVGTEWLAKDRKSATLEEIITVTGHSKRRLNKAVLQRSSRNRELILISSVIDWLKNAPKPSDKPEQNRANTDPLLATNGHSKETQPLDNFVELTV